MEAIESETAERPAVRCTWLDVSVVSEAIHELAKVRVGDRSEILPDVTVAVGTSMGPRHVTQRDLRRPCALAEIVTKLLRRFRLGDLQRLLRLVKSGFDGWLL